MPTALDPWVHISIYRALRGKTIVCVVQLHRTVHSIFLASEQFVNTTVASWYWGHDFVIFMFKNYNCNDLLNILS